MQDHTLRYIAFLVARLRGQRNSPQIYDHADNSWYLYSGSVAPGRANIYDYSRSCFVGGTGTPLSLYDYGDSAFVRLQLNGDTFRGYDFGAKHFYLGRLANSNVTIYDFGRSIWRQFSISG